MIRATFAIVAMAACGYPPLAQSDGGSGNHNHSMNGDGGAACDAPADFGNVTPGSPGADYYQPSGQGPGELDVAGVVGSGSDYLEFVLVAGAPPLDGSDDIPLSGSWSFATTNLAQCGVCAAIYTDATSSPLAATGTFNTMYIATGGSVSYSYPDNSPNATVTITGAEFAQATYTGSNSNDNTTQLTSGGCTTKVDSISFNVDVTDN